MRERLAQVAAAVADRAAERRGALTEDDAVRLQSALDALKRDYAEPFSAGDDAGHLDALAEVFGLDETSTNLFVAAVAPEFDASFAVAYDILAGGAPGGWITVGLALELCRLPTAGPSAFAHLDPAAPLRREGLLHVHGDTSWLRRSLRVPDRVIAHLAGVDIPDPIVAAAAIDTLPFDCPESAHIAKALAATRSMLWLYSPRGTAGAAVAVAAFGELGLGCLVVNLHLVGQGAALADLIFAAGREAAFAGAGLVVVGGEVLAEQPTPSDERRAALRALERVRVPVVAVGTCGWDPAWLRTVALSFDAPVIGAPERAAMWSEALGTDLPSQPGETPLSALRLSPDEVSRAAGYAREVAAIRAEPVTATAARAAVRVLSRNTRTLSSVGGQTSRLPATFADLVLPERVLVELKRLVSWAVYRDEVLARGPVHGKGDQGEGITALFTGGPGTGKTLSAHVLAGELGLELLQVELPSIVDKYIGETEKNLERVFREAEQRNVLLFFDEADALFGTRSEVKDSRDRYANQEVAYLLQRMEHFNGITLLATNLSGNLDKAFSRRMHFIIHFPDPDEKTRRRLWGQLVANAGPLDANDPIDLDALAATGDLTGGDIRNVVMSATYDATAEGSGIGMRHLLAAKEREFRKLGRRLP